MSKVVFLNFPIDYIAEYIPPHRQALYWEKYSNKKVQLPFYIRETIPFFGRR
jgi:hypothetical protein